MSGIRAVAQWLRAGLLMGFPMALALSAILAAGDHFQLGCRATGLTTVLTQVGFAVLVEADTTGGPRGD